MKHDAVDVAIQRVNQPFVSEIKVAGVELERGRIRSGIENAGEAPSCRDHKARPEDEEESDEDDDEHGLCLQNVLRAERAKHTETSLAGDHHRHKTRGRVERIKSNQVVAQHKLNNETASRGASYLQVNPVGIEDKAHSHVQDVSQRLDKQTQVDPLLQAVFDEHHHAQDVGRSASKIK